MVTLVWRRNPEAFLAAGRQQTSAGLQLVGHGTLLTRIDSDNHQLAALCQQHMTP